MASLYKKPITMTDPATGRKIKAKSKKWWGMYRDAAGKLCRVPLAIDKPAAQAMLNKLVRNVERTLAGLIDPTDEQRKRPLVEHLAEFRKYLENKGVTLPQVQGAIMQIGRIIASRQWKFISDISASGALACLGELRASGRSAQTYNHYLKSAKQFTRWLVREQRTSLDPLAHLSRLNVDLDRRHRRRPLKPEEFARLLDAAEHGETIESIPGPDRAMMYVLAAWTGFRKGEIGSLTQLSLRLDDEPPTATVAACHSKRRREDTQILHPELVRRLKVWLATKPQLKANDLLFPVSSRVNGLPERKTSKMMRLDLETARKKWLNEPTTKEEKNARKRSDFLSYCNEAGQFADFHSNRHLFITSLEKAGLSPKMAQTLARHSDIRLTLGLYTHVGLHDQSTAIAMLPAPPSTENSAKMASQIA